MKRQKQKVNICLEFKGSADFDPLRDGWLFLGKSVERRSKLQASLGRVTEVDASEAMRRAEIALREPFLNFIATIAVEQQDNLVWWTTSLSWKDGPCSLFLLLCYRSVVAALSGLTEASSVYVFVEDPWLFRQLQLDHMEDEHIDFFGFVSPRLIAFCLRRLAYGLVRRLLWLKSSVLSYLRLRNRTCPDSCDTSVDVALYSLPQSRCLVEKGGWYDPYLTSLDEDLRAWGLRVKRFAPPSPVGFEADLASRKDVIVPLIKYWTWQSCLVAILAWWWPKSRNHWNLCGKSVAWLVWREWFQDLGYSVWTEHLFLHACFTRYLQDVHPKVVVYPFENQPWEKMLAAVSLANGIGTIGYQHATVPPLLLAHFLGQGESKFAPMPNFILTSGPYTTAQLKKGGFPSERIIDSGSLRYRHLDSDEPALAAANPNHILVILSLDPTSSAHLVAAVEELQGLVGQGLPLKFYLKFHPYFHGDKGQLQRRILGSEIINGSIIDGLRQCGSVIFSDSTAGIEALVMGRRVLRYQPEVLLDIDPCPTIPSELLPRCSRLTIKSTFLELVREGRPKLEPGQALELRDQLFTLYRPLIWQQAVFGLVQKHDDLKTVKTFGQA